MVNPTTPLQPLVQDDLSAGYRSWSFAYCGSALANPGLVGGLKWDGVGPRKGVAWPITRTATVVAMSEE